MGRYVATWGHEMSETEDATIERETEDDVVDKTSA